MNLYKIDLHTEKANIEDSIRDFTLSNTILQKREKELNILLNELEQLKQQNKQKLNQIEEKLRIDLQNHKIQTTSLTPSVLDSQIIKNFILSDDIKKQNILCTSENDTGEKHDR